jgi:acetyltransferase-like isoleucine patch superfamily enzyme
MPGVIMNTFAQIENYCIINTGSVLEHDCKMEDFSSLATGVKTGGLVVIKKFTAVAIGAILRDRVTVGEHSVIGMGAVVTKDIPSFSVAYGIPAKIIGKRKIGEKYMK